MRQVNPEWPNRLRNNGGFTLTELLVVIAILAIILAMLMPMVSSAMGMARGLRCTSNMRQFGMANIAYAHDYEGWSVPASIDGSGSHGMMWMRIPEFLHLAGVTPLGSGGQAWHWVRPAQIACPSVETRHQGLYVSLWGSYGINRTLGPQGGGGTALRQIMLSNIGNPSNKIFLMDHFGFQFSYSTIMSNPGRYFVDKQGMGFRHSGAANAAFYDGSVRPLRFTYIMDLEQKGQLRQQHFDVNGP